MFRASTRGPRSLPNIPCSSASASPRELTSVGRADIWQARRAPGPALPSPLRYDGDAAPNGGRYHHSRRSSWIRQRTIEQRVNTEANPGAESAEHQRPSRVLAEDEVRISHRVREGDARPCAHRRADYGAVQQSITPLRQGLVLAKR